MGEIMSRQLELLLEDLAAELPDGELHLAMGPSMLLTLAIEVLQETKRERNKEES